MTKAQANYLLRRCYRVLRDADRIERIKMQTLDKFSALLMQDRTIIIDPTEAILPSIVHEICHELYPDYGEGLIKGMESEMVRLLTPRQWRNLYHVVSEIL